jgi:hypothetical protein
MRDRSQADRVLAVKSFVFKGRWKGLLSCGRPPGRDAPWATTSVGSEARPKPRTEQGPLWVPYPPFPNRLVALPGVPKYKVRGG